MLKDIKNCVALGWSNWTMCNKNIRFEIKIIKILKEPKFGEKLKLLKACYFPQLLKLQQKVKEKLLNFLDKIP